MHRLSGEVVGYKTYNGKRCIASYYERQDIKRKDFAKFDRELYDLGIVEYPSYSKEILEHTKFLIPTFIDEDDIKLTIRKIYIYLKQAKLSKHEYTILNKEELEKLTNDATIYIINKLNELKLIKGCKKQ